MIVEINRTGKRVNLLKTNKALCPFVTEIAKQYGYFNVSVLDIENYKSIEWDGIEFNRLLRKENTLYRFNNWIGEYPFTGIEIEEIGKIID